jgi:flagellar capping protein FliD
MMDEIQNGMMTSVDGLGGGIYQWYDIGIQFEYDSEEMKSSLEIDTATLREKLNSNFEDVRDLMTLSTDMARGDQNAYVSVSNAAGNGTSVDNLINGDISSSNFPVTNGYEGTDPVDDDEITINFSEPRSIYQLVLHHMDSASMPAEDWAISDFTVEYWDTLSKSWQNARDYRGNKSSINYISLPEGAKTDKIKITVHDTNAADKKARLMEVEALEKKGVGSKLRNSLDSFTDTIDGIFASRNAYFSDQIDDLESQIENMEDRLEMKEINLLKQFSAMENALAELQSQSDFFTQQMASMNKSD